MNSDDTPKDGSLIPVSKDRSLVARSASLAKRGLASLQTLDRVVRFPSDVSIGNVYLFDRDSDINLRFGHINTGDQQNILEFGIEHFENVLGDLRVSKGKILVLRVSDDSKLPLLSTLASDSLDGLFLSNSVLAEEVSCIEHLSGLQYLGLSMHCGTDRTLSHLSNLKSLSHLLFRYPKMITDFGMSYLSNLKSLTHLDLYKTQITDNGLSHLSNLKSLTQLSLGYTKVTDNGLSYLSTLTSLSHLDLSQTEITDDGLACLSNLTSLKKLFLKNTAVTETGIQNLKTFLPDCKVVYSGS